MSGKKLIRPLLIFLPVLVLILLAGLSPSGTPPSRPLPNPNGYEDFLKAADTLSGDVSGSSAMDHGPLRQLISSNAQPLQLLRFGLSRQCSVPTAASLTNLESWMGDLSKLKSIGRLVVEEGRLAQMENRPGDAIRCYLDAIRLGNELSRGGFLIHRLVGVAVQIMGVVPLARLAPSLNCEAARPIIAELEKVEAGAVRWEEVMDDEKAYARASTRHFFMGPVQRLIIWWQSRATFAHAKAQHEKVAARLRLLITELALRCFRAETGQPPARLEELVPKFARQVPADPFSGKPLIYRVEGTNWVLYSVGPDGVDDGGRPTSSSPPATGDLLFDSRW